MKSRTLTLLAAAGVIASLAQPAFAGDIQGDAYSCQELWVMRNQIYKDNGYCFHTSRAISYFGNGGCSYNNDASVPLSKHERHMVRMIQASESRQGC